MAELLGILPAAVCQIELIVNTPHRLPCRDFFLKAHAEPLESARARTNNLGANSQHAYKCDAAFQRTHEVDYPKQYALKIARSGDLQNFEQRQEPVTLDEVIVNV